MKLKYLYHGSQTSGIKLLEPRIKTKRFNQKNARVYAVVTKAEAAIFGLPWHNENHISWKNGRITLHVRNRRTYKKHPISIYQISPEYFQDVDKTGFEWFTTRPVVVEKEIRIKDALKYAKRQGAIIIDETE